ncbi:hypothetical protein HMPREF1402_01055 [Helicobacter pylori GAM121Aii]|nr:hypothetical protein HMPREF1402_01055 [Helicobacter pylori GAM121Aii]
MRIPLCYRVIRICSVLIAKSHKLKPLKNTTKRISIHSAKTR